MPHDRRPAESASLSGSLGDLRAPLRDGQAKLRTGYKRLAEDFARVKEDWQDEQCRRFEQDHLAPLGPSAQRLSLAVDELVELMTRLDRELSDD